MRRNNSTLRPGNLVSYATVLSPGPVTLNSSGPISPDATFSVLGINQTVGAAITIFIDPTSLIPGKTYTIADEKGDAFTNPITLEPLSGLIDGSATLVMNNNYESIDFYSNGTNLKVI